MNRGHFLFVCATLLCFYLYAAAGQNGNPTGKIPRTGFTCTGRPAGYYADMETGCQVYHMCDGLGRQFSYSCPNTTLFQQRMLICDHWYMVNCSMSSRDYDANLLIGQRDKPFVSEEEMRQRTPRPDILSVPPNSNYFEGLKESESKFAIHPGNSIVGIADTISSGDNNDLDSGKQNYRPPTSWSTKKPREEKSTRFEPSRGTNHGIDEDDNLAGAASQKPGPTIRPIDDRRPTTEPTPKTTFSRATPPSRDLVPPPAPTTEASSEEFQIDARMKVTEDPVFNFIKRFDPNSPDSIKTSMTKTEILDINKQLPEGQVSSEDDRTPRKQKNFGTNFNNVQRNNEKGVTEGTRFDNVNVKPTQPPNLSTVPEPSRELVPPKTDYSQLPTSTEGPPIYYEWKWAVPAFDLEPPKLGNETNTTSVLKPRASQGRSPFRDVPKPTPADIEPTPPPKNTEYNISSYFVPDYVFPLDKPHPGYDNDDAQTSFQVKVSRPGRASYGENPACPQCHPAYLEPGTCEPCIVKR